MANKVYGNKKFTNKARVCHRCGKAYINNDLRHLIFDGQRLDVDYPVMGVKFMTIKRSGDGHVQHNTMGPFYTLCDDCLKDLMEFLRRDI